MKNKITYFTFLFLVVFIALELSVRLISDKNEFNVTHIANKKGRYLLPLPNSPEDYVSAFEEEQMLDAYRVFDDTLGWSHGSWGVDTLVDFECFANDAGVRIKEADWKLRVPAEKHYDIITIGNSFTHGDAVDAEQTWPHLLSEQTKRSVANLGVGGYGIHQALLRLITSGISGDTILFGVVSDDLNRSLTPVYNFILGGNKTKPILKFNDDFTYSLDNVPTLTPRQFYELKSHSTQNSFFSYIPNFSEDVFKHDLLSKIYIVRMLRSLKHQYFYGPPDRPLYMQPGSDLNYCLNIFELFKVYCDHQGSYGLVVLLDNGLNFGEDALNGNPWTTLMRELENRGIPYVNFHNELYEEYLHENKRVLHNEEKVHYSKEGNSIVANLIIASFYK